DPHGDAAVFHAGLVGPEDEDRRDAKVGDKGLGRFTKGERQVKGAVDGGDDDKDGEENVGHVITSLIVRETELSRGDAEHPGDMQYVVEARLPRHFKPWA